LAFTSFVLVATAALIELLLQSGAYAVYLANRKDIEAAQPQTRTVLCIGDSWTHGMGTSNAAQHSYPSVLERVLRERTKQDWSVVNGGQSGQNSRDVLLRLQSQLDTVKPQVVCVLVGRNDPWSTPEEAPSAESEDRFTAYRFRWRLPRLFAWTMDSLSSPTNIGPLDKTGPEWVSKQIPWPPPPPSVVYPVAVSSEATAAKTAGWKLEAEGLSEQALEQFRAAFADAPEDPQTRGMLARLTQKCGRTDESQTHAAWLVERWSQKQDFYHGIALLDFYSFCGRSQDQLDQACMLLKQFPEDPTIWYQRGEAEHRLGLKEDAAKSLTKCIETWHNVYAYSILFKIALFDQRDHAEAVNTIFRSYVTTNEHEATSSMLNTMLELPTVDGDSVSAQADAFACDPSTKARIQVLVAEALRRRDGASAERILRSHLKRIADLTRSKGATPVFLDYPIPTPLQHCLRDVANEDSIHFIDIKPQWESRVPQERHKQLRSADGHVNDEGYRIMAECVADGLMPILQTLK
jgi:lysophospholipase L1-like esterase/tetratricopeptide (TPR) repeat protein